MSQTQARLSTMNRNSSIQAIVIGASAGALEALSALFADFPKTFRLPIFVVVHLPPDRDSALADCIRAKCRLDVKEAEDKVPIQPATIYFAPPDYHLLVESDQRLSLSSEEPVRYSRPSIDVLFESAADVYGSALIGVVLTGANDDGKKGLRAVLDEGGIGLVQRPDLAEESMMPQSALDACPEARAMSLAEIATYLQEVDGPI